MCNPAKLGRYCWMSESGHPIALEELPEDSGFNGYLGFTSGPYIAGICLLARSLASPHVRFVLLTDKEGETHVDLMLETGRLSLGRQHHHFFSILRSSNLARIITRNSNGVDEEYTTPILIVDDILALDP